MSDKGSIFSKINQFFFNQDVIVNAFFEVFVDLNRRPNVKYFQGANQNIRHGITISIYIYITNPYLKVISCIYWK